MKRLMVWSLCASLLLGVPLCPLYALDHACKHFKKEISEFSAEDESSIR